MATFLRHSCRALEDGAACAELAAGHWTWAAEPQRGFETHFEPLRPFSLPGALWLHRGFSNDFVHFRALVGFGHAPALGVVGDTLVAVEARVDASCLSGSRLHRVTRTLPSGVEAAAVPLGCEWRVVATSVSSCEPVYGALALKWAGPWADGPLLTAVDMAAGVYHLCDTAETEVGDPSTEHVVWTHGAAVVALRDGEQTLLCTALGTDGTPSDVAIAAASA